MSTDLDLRWEWPAERQAQIKLMMTVEKTKAADQGLFGIKKSPSLAGSLPDPVEVTGVITKGDATLINKSVRLVLPKMELGETGAGDNLLLGVINNNICICIKKAESAATEPGELDC